MRCPYCGGLNADQAAFCARCGRDLKAQPVGRPHPPVSQSPQPPVRPSIPPQPVQTSMPPQVPIQASQSRTSVSSKPRVPAAQAPRTPHPLAILPDEFAGVDIVPVTGPEPPAPFPPHILSHLHALEVGALPYTEISDETALGGKRIVRIFYARCLHWQQAATLLKASKQYQSTKYSTLIVQGLYNHEANLYSFNNGQLVFDRGVRLGSQILNRYQIETGTGYEGEAVRFVLTE